ncbi:MAG TPA: alpha/beta fold hydrolase [Mycobacteriales bacterium]|nr:alpha/beta fold hydrolase [Mycobacteriales bacterium]
MRSAAIAALTLAAACSSSVSTGGTPPPPTSAAVASSAASPSAAPTASVPAALSWGKCDFDGPAPHDECAVLQVPLDYTDPSGKTIGLQLVRRPAGKSSEREGSLLFNPGGPGASVSDQFDAYVSQFSSDLRDHFDIVGWDPRGVGRSSPVHCATDAQLDHYLSIGDDLDIPAQKQQFVDAAKAYVAGCAKNSGDLLAHVGTIDTAHDMDLIRAALGDQKLSFLGFSYGTVYGMTYAHFFPDKVRALALDGAVDPRTSAIDDATTQAAGFESNIRAFLAHCKSEGDSCGWNVDDPQQAYLALIDQIRDHPLPTHDKNRPLTLNLFMNGVALAMYDTSIWPLLEHALAKASSGDGSGMLTLADELYSRSDDGKYPNELDAFTAISCIDQPFPADLSAYVTLFDELQKADPLYTADNANPVGPGYTCGIWPVHPANTSIPTTVPATVPPVLIVGSSDDPATPFSEALGLQQVIPGSYLLERKGEGHTGYSASQCVQERVDAYLVHPDQLPDSKHVVCAAGT